MFKELLNYNQIGTKVEIGYILFDILKSDTSKSIDDIKTQCLHYSYSFGNCFNSTILLLKTLELVIYEKGKIRRNPDLDIYGRDSLFDSGFFFEKIIGLLELNQQFMDFFNSNTVKFSVDKEKYYLRDSHIPIKHSTIKRILINTDLLLKDPNVRTIFYVNDKYHGLFNKLVIDKMKTTAALLKQKRQLSLENLKARQRAQEELGLQAELFVLAYEKRRLNKHPLSGMISRISEDHTNAGYDIESFNDVETILINRFIEVKSFSGNVSFYWSSNEIETAKEKKDQYYIYLVNREDIGKPGYNPLMISDPYKNIFENSHWHRNVESYKFYTNGVS
ncbi:MAG: DUF3883 domain-containing protein [Mucilaginibacter sp.]